MSHTAGEAVCLLPGSDFFCPLRLPTGVNHHTTRCLSASPKPRLLAMLLVVTPLVGRIFSPFR
jgi:hypothetical protein